MPDPRWDELAEILIGHSTRLASGETLLVECFDLEDGTLPRLLVQKAARRGANALVETKDTRITRELIRNATEAQMRLIGESELYRMSRVQAYIGLRGARNINEMADVPLEKMSLFNTHVYKPVHMDCRIRTTRWCVLRLPNASMAQQAGMSTEAFENFYFDVCNLDYPRLARALRPLVDRMEAAKDVQITGPETDLRFSIAGIPVVPCAGEMNIPDGEVFTAPVRNSVEGVVRDSTRRRSIRGPRSTGSARLRGRPDRRGRLLGWRRQEAPAHPRIGRRARPTSASGRSAATRESCTRCVTSSSTRRSPAAFT